MRCEDASQPQQVTLGAHERCHGCHRVRVESKIRRIPSATNDFRYKVFTVPRLSQQSAVSGVPLDNLLPGPKPFSVYRSPLSRPSALRRDSSGHRWSHSSSPSALDSVISLGAKVDKNIFARHANEACETNVRPKCFYAARRIRWNGPFLSLPQVHSATIVTSNRCYTTNLIAARNLGNDQCGHSWAAEETMLGRKEIPRCPNQSACSLTGIFEFYGLLLCHWSGLAHSFRLGPPWSALASAGLAVDARKV